MKNAMAILWKKWLVAVLTVAVILPVNFSGIANAYPTSFTYEAENLQTDVGFEALVSPVSMRAEVANSTVGYLIAGPATSDQLPGKRYRVNFDVRYLNHTAATPTALPIARLEIDNVGNELLADKELYMSDFDGAGIYKTISMDFTRVNIGSMNYKVWFYDRLDFDVDKIVVEELAPSDNVKYESEHLRTGVGNVVADATASNGKVLQSNATGYIQYGPYTADQAPDDTFRATFRMKVADNSSPAVVARIDASNSHGTGQWVFQDLKGTDFPAADTFYAFSVDFNRKNEGTMEFRVYGYGVTTVSIDYVEVNKITATAGVYESESLSSNFPASIVIDGSASSGQARQAGPADIGYLQYGPYTVEQASGHTYRAMFRMSVSNNSASGVIARIEAHNHNGSGAWNYRNISASDFMGSNYYQNFNVDFTRTTDGTMEYRVYVFGNASGVSLKVDQVEVFEVQEAQNNWKYESETGLGQVGRQVLDTQASNQLAREATVTGDNAGYLVYGPYTDTQPENQVYVASFRLKTRNNSVSDNVAIVDVNNPGGTSQYVYKNIKGTDFSANNQWQTFDLKFNKKTGGVLEFRVYFTDKADILSDYVEITPDNTNEIVYEAESLFTGPASQVVTDANASGGKVVKAAVIPSLGIVNPYAAECPRPAGYVYKIGDNFCEYSTNQVVVYGPYTIDQAQGNYEVTFRLKHSSTGTTSNLALIDIFNNGGTGTYVYSELNKTKFGTDYTDVTLNYYRTGDGVMEYRVFYTNIADVYLDKITVKKI